MIYQNLIIQSSVWNKLNNYLKKFNLKKKFINLGKINDQINMKLLYAASDLIIFLS